jgi:hypothetical protein
MFGVLLRLDQLFEQPLLCGAGLDLLQTQHGLNTIAARLVLVVGFENTLVLCSATDAHIPSTFLQHEQCLTADRHFLVCVLN